MRGREKRERKKRSEEKREGRLSNYISTNHGRLPSAVIVNYRLTGETSSAVSYRLKVST